MNEKSKFVTVLAWILIVLAGLTTIFAFSSTVLIYFVIPADLTDRLTHEVLMEDPRVASLTAFWRWVALNPGPVSLVRGLTSAFVLICAIGLLQRRNWARLALITVLVLYAGLEFGLLVVGEITNPVDSLVQRAYEIALSLAVLLLSVWIIRKLTSAHIRREFAV